MKKKLTGQITIETAMVFPIVMMIVASLIYFSLYVHDIITIKSFAYSVGVQNCQKEFDGFEKAVTQKMIKIPVFVSTTKVLCTDKNSYYEICIQSDSSTGVKWMEALTGKNENNQIVKIEKKMSKEIMYGCRAVFDEVK